MDGVCDGLARTGLSVDRLLSFLGEPIMTAHLGVAFAKDGNREMVQKLSEALESMKKDGSISAITKKYEMVLWEQEEESADDAS